MLSLGSLTMNLNKFENSCDHNSVTHNRTCHNILFVILLSAQISQERDYLYKHHEKVL
jgi:hypothetical protein